MLRGFSEMEKDSQQNVCEGQSEGVAQAGWGVDGNVDGQQERNEDLVPLLRGVILPSRGSVRARQMRFLQQLCHHLGPRVSLAWCKT